MELERPNKNSRDARSQLSASKQELLRARLQGKAFSQSKEDITPRPAGEPIPLSFAQQRLWFLHHLVSNNPLYNVSLGFRFTGTLDAQKMERALNKLVERHESLRTTFSPIEANPVQYISLPKDIQLKIVDLRSLSESERKPEARRLQNEYSLKPFDLAKGPLFRFTLFQLSSDTNELLITLHHIVTDGWSTGVLLRDFAELYEAEVNKTAPKLPELTIQYADFSYWQRQRLQGEFLEKQTAYWRSCLAGAPETLGLPIDFVRPLQQTYGGATEKITLPRELCEKLKELSQREQCTFFMTLLAAFNVLLHRLAGQEDLLVGSANAGRNRHATENLIGFFVNTLVLRTNAGGNPSFLQLLARTRETALGATANQDLPFEKLVEELQPARSLSHTPFFQVFFNLLNFTEQTFSLPDLEAKPFWLDDTTAKFDLTLFAEETKNGMLVTMSYNVDLFRAETMVRWLGYWRTLLEEIAKDPSVRIGELPMLGATEREQLLVNWNRSATPYPAKRIHQLFEEQAAKRPNAIALIANESQISYEQLNNRANGLAHRLQENGIKSGTFVAICAERSVEAIVGLVAILKAGGVYVPIDPAYPKERQAFMLKDTNAPVLLTVRKLESVLPSHQAKVLFLDDTIAESPNNKNVEGTPEDLAYVMYTSGSTGQPKGTLIPHRGVVRLVKETNYASFGVDDVFLQFAPISFDASTLEIWGPLLNGGRLVIMPPESGTLEDLGTAVKKHQVTTLWLTAGLFHLMVNERIEDLKCVRQLLAGGDVLSVPHVRKALELLPGCKVINGYGPTENTTFTCCHSITLEDTKGTSIPIGRPIANTTVYILDARRQPVPTGVAGELYIGGDGLALGYLNQQGLTAETFVDNPFDNKGKLYRTGDLCRYTTSGVIEFLGRIDSQVKIRGFRIELGEIETALRGHEQVREAVVNVWGASNDKRLAAYIVFKNGTVSSAELKGFLQKTLPDYMVPSSFITLDEVPLTANGKVDRKALPSPETAESAPTESYVAPRNPTEEVLANIWAELLRVKRVGIHDNFFDLGGHSLIATQVISRVRKTCKAEVSLRKLLERPTVEEMAKELEEISATTTAVSRRPAGEPPALSFAQQRIWFLDQFEPNNSLYNIPIGFSFKGSLDIDKLKSALNKLVQRHESLRTTFTSANGNPVQQIAPPHDVHLQIIDLQGYTDTDRKAETKQIQWDEANKLFDLAKGPLFRATLLKLSPEENELLITLHHIISDGWSLGILLRELTEFYSSDISGSPANLPELPIQYADYGHWQRQWLQGDVLKKQLNYWKTQLANSTATLDLQTDYPRPPHQTFKGATESITLPRELCERLKALSQQNQSTFFMVLLAGFQVLLHRLSGQDDIAVGSAIAGRNRRETEDLIGFFVNTLVFRTNTGGNPKFLELLSRTRETALDADTHQDLPFEMLVEQLQPVRSLNHTPFFQAFFNLLNFTEEKFALPGLTANPFWIEETTAKFDLTLSAEERKEGLVAALSYKTALFKEETMVRWLGYWRTLLEEIAKDPSVRIGELPMLGATEREQLLVNWNRSATPYPAKRIHQLFEEQAAKRPNAIALIANESQISYEQLNNRANGLAHRLQENGIKSGTFVAICAERSVEAIVGLVAILKAGGVYVPIDPAYPKERQAFMLKDTNAPVLLTVRKLESVLPSHHAKVLFLDDTIAESPNNKNVEGTPEDLAYVMYTSGSTGQPKGTLIPHRGVVRLVKETNYASFGVDDVFLQFAPISFDASTLEIWGPLLNGGRLVIMPPESGTLEDLGTAVKKHQVTTLWLTAGLFHLMVNERIEDLKCVRQLLAGGDVLSVPHVRKALELLPGCKVINGYGPTENTTFTCCHSITLEDTKGTSIPIGRPIANTTVYILDARRQPVPTGVAGELYIGGDGLALGYLNQQGLTAETFVDNPFDNKGKLYRTGDLCRYTTSGVIEFLGRIDSQVKIRGFRIELEEIKTVLKKHADIQDAHVAVITTRPSEKRIAAYFVAKKNPAPPAIELRSFLKDHLPEYMVPETFAAVDKIPLTANGKVDRQALASMGKPAANDRTGQYAGPRTPIEETLVNLWSEVLRVERIGIHDNFFELGGHSLLTIQIIDRMNKAGLKVSLGQFFQRQTIAELADVVNTSQTVTSTDDKWFSLVTLQPRGTKPPFYLVHTAPGDLLGYMKLVYYLGPDQPCYGFQSLGLMRKEASHTTLPEMAAHYVNLLREFQPKGPYNVGGWCFGGNVAVEMAHQLKAQGEEVALLALFETWAHPPPLTHYRFHLHRLRCFLRMGFSGISRFFKWRIDQTLKSADSEEFAFATDQSGPLVNREHVYAINLRATKQQQSRHYHGKVTLFNSSYSNNPAYKDEYCGFATLADATEIHLTPGDHRSIIKEPNVQHLAKALSECLQKSQPDGTGMKQDQPDKPASAAQSVHAAPTH